MDYKVLNPIDEKGRLMRMPNFYEATSGSQFDSHGYSYLFVREILKEDCHNQPIGLELLV